MLKPVVRTGLTHKYLKLEDMRALHRMFFSRRRPVDGRYAGRHATNQRGHSVEFSDYRQYMPGDELGDVDWKVLARSDKMVIKLFEHETDMTVHLVVDASASMAYRGISDKRAPSKFDLACRIAAAIAFLNIKQQDRVSLSFARKGLLSHTPPAGTFPHLLQMLEIMERVDTSFEAGLEAALTDLAGRTSRRALLVVLSDLLEERDPIMGALNMFIHRGGEAILFHILHAEELTLPDLDEAIFHDSETGSRVRMNVPEAREEYQKAIQAYMDGWRGACVSRAIDYRMVTTNMDYRQALASYLFSRSNAH